MTPGLYNNMYQIVQTRDAILIDVEMVHDARIIRLDRKTHLPPSVRPWMGDSIGWWEGDTLVVETTNFHPEQNFRGSSGNLKVTERFTPVGPNRLHYAFWVEDPTVFSPAVGRRVRVLALQGAGLRIRLPRGQLRPDEHPLRRPDGGEDRHQDRPHQRRPARRPGRRRRRGRQLSDWVYSRTRE
jgi:hypothetical protein